MNSQQILDTIIAWDDLVATGKVATQIDEMYETIDLSLPMEWKRDRSLEQQASTRGSALSGSRCFARESGSNRVALWLLRVTPLRVQGGLVDPSTSTWYLKAIAEAIVDFKTRILVPAAEITDVRLSRNRLGPLSHVPATVLEALWAFHESNPCVWPPDGPSLHKWHKFVANACQDRAAFNLDELPKWLIDKGWKPTDANSAVDRLLADAELIEEYDELRQPA